MTDALKPPGEPNELVLGISCPWRVDERSFYLQPSTVFSVILKNSEYMKGNLLHYWDGLPLSGNAVFPFGPWRDIAIECRTGPTLRRVSVSTLSLDDGAADVQVDCEWWSDAPEERAVELEIEIAAETFSGRARSVRTTARVAPGDSESQLRLTLEKPRLWWTWDTGAQDLYRATVDAGTGGGRRLGVRRPAARARLRDARLLAQRAAPLPARRLVPVREHLQRRADRRGAPARRRDAARRQQQPHRRVHVRREGRALRRVRPARHARVPGAAVPPARPDARARSGLSALPGVLGLRRSARSRTSSSSCAATHRWCCGPRSPRRASRSAGSGATTATTATQIGEIVRRHDPDAIYHPSFCDFKEEHIWNGGFPFGEFSDHYDRNHRFISEFGAIAPPVVETLREIMPPEAVWGVAGRARGAARSCRSTPRSTRTAGRSTTRACAPRWRACSATSIATVPTARALRRRDPVVPGVRPALLRRGLPAQALRGHRRLPDLVVPGERARDQVHGRRPPPAAEARLFRAASRPTSRSSSASTIASPCARAAPATGTRTTSGSSTTRRATSSSRSTSRLLDARGGSSGAAWSGGDGRGDSGQVLAQLDLELPRRAGPYLVRSTATATRTARRRPSREVGAGRAAGVRASACASSCSARRATTRRSWKRSRDVAGIELTVVDEERRVPQDSAWSEGLDGRVDVVWFAGWDYAAHQFRESEWANIAAAVPAGVGFVHTGGQASFHGGDGAGRMLDITPLGEVLPVSLRPHDGVWDRMPRRATPVPDRRRCSLPRSTRCRSAASAARPRARTPRRTGRSGRIRCS